MATAWSSLLQEAGAVEAWSEEETTPTGWGAAGSPPGKVVGAKGGLLKVGGASAAESIPVQDDGTEEGTEDWTTVVKGKTRKLVGQEGGGRREHEVQGSIRRQAGRIGEEEKTEPRRNVDVREGD